MTNDDGTITLTIREFMDYGLEVFDPESKKVGSVYNYDHATGYMQVRPHAFSESFLYIPFRDITHIDPREMFISKSTWDAHREYASPRPRDTFVEKRKNPDTGEDDSRAITTEPNGYDGAPVVVETANIGQLAHHIAPGFRVYTSEMEDLGPIRQYDRATGEMLVKRGTFPNQTLVVPLAVVNGVDREDRKVYLAVSSTDLERHPVVGTWNPEREELVVEAEITES